MHGVGCGSAKSRPIFKEFKRQGSDSSTDWLFHLLSVQWYIDIKIQQVPRL